MRGKKIIGYAEAAFNILYLCALLIMGINIAVSAQSTENFLFAIMVFVLLIGDSFHLIPRIALSFFKNPKGLEGHLGRGKMAASIGMTLFYVLLWHIGILHFSPKVSVYFTVFIYLLAAIRIFLTVLPQNKWEENEPSRAHPFGAWNLYRNIPFILLGFAVCVLFFVHKNSAMAEFKWMWLAIFLSFVFYIPVVLGAKKHPALGVLMIPKTCFYIWMVAMGL